MDLNRLVKDLVDRSNAGDQVRGYIVICIPAGINPQSIGTAADIQLFESSILAKFQSMLNAFQAVVVVCVGTYGRYYTSN